MIQAKTLVDFSSAIPAAPPIPSVIRYVDDFEEQRHSIHDTQRNDRWLVSTCGSKQTLDFTSFAEPIRNLLKAWCAYELQTFASSTAVSYFNGLRRCADADILWMMCSSPFEIRINWNILLGSGYTADSIGAIKSLLYYLARFNLGGWSSDYLSYLNTLPLPYSDAYAAVRTGDAFLSVNEEAALIGYFDSVTAALAESALNDNDLVEAGVLICSYQFGLRPVQIGRIPMKDVQIWRDTQFRLSAVHLTFKMAKQRSARAALPMTRKVKHEWAPIFVELYQRGERSGLSPTSRLFRVSSAAQTGKIIVDATTRLLGSPRSATTLRHTAAQRLADSGASQAEVAEFLGHSLIQTSGVYFTASPSQAERVNRALGISPRYKTIMKVAKDGYISREELARLKGEQQVAGVPHGIPLTGIGGCTVGQPSCPFNPVTSCYGCQKFMPLAELEIHKQVLADLRTVVRDFSDVGRGDLSSPAYQQLERTISSVQAVITELEGGEQK